MKLFIEQMHMNSADEMIGCIEAKEISWDDDERELIVTIDACDEQMINERDLKIYIIDDPDPFRSKFPLNTASVCNKYIPYAVTNYNKYKQVCVVTLQSMYEMFHGGLIY